jgi:Thioredoxin domain
MEYGILMTPGLVVNEEVKSVGIIPSESQLHEWIKA